VQVGVGYLLGRVLGRRRNRDMLGDCGMGRSVGRVRAWVGVRLIVLALGEVRVLLVAYQVWPQEGERRRRVVHIGRCIGLVGC
jgi:hypothetical protein